MKRNLLYQTGYKTPYRRKVIRSQDKTNTITFLLKIQFILMSIILKKGTIEFNLLFTKESVINNLIKIYKNNHNINVNQFEIYIAQRKIGHI